MNLRVIEVAQDRSRQYRQHLAEVLTEMFDSWSLTTADRLTLLGLCEINRAALQRYASGKALAANRDLLDRAEHLISIHRSLKALYPCNSTMAAGWMNSPNDLFGAETPIEMVRKFGLPGLLLLRNLLDEG